MPTDLQILTGQESFLALVDETTWGEYPDPATLIHLPVDTYDVEYVAETRNATPFTGYRQRQHGRRFRGMPSGNLNTNLFGFRQAEGLPSLAEFLLTWAFGSPEAKFRASKSANWYEGLNVDNQRHRGLRVNQATLAGQEGGAITLALALMGRDQQGQTDVGNAPAVPFDRKKLVEFDFIDSTLTLGGTPIPYGGFSLVTNHNLTAPYLNSPEPISMPAGDTVETVTFSPPKLTNTWSEAIRDLNPEEQEVSATLVLKGLHMGTGAAETDWTQITITMPRLFLRAAKTGRQRGILQQPLEFDVEKPQTSGGNGISIAYADVA
ncbi:hypothetical protein Spb1_20440 [Planctopirus ephydatiae]|uniref:Uncharacterized protein n=1 Tax=Planctopirus ephydatiae TaxID=2528019 RepID=A0A518GNG7_9PLAN|nr:phage tail tube protein [Planctopirus ephydatiae]QDV30116.1 hypothetical protein Spb1_20440 [Planctopirus ephydatiae]